MIDETHVRRLHDARSEDAALVLLEGRAHVVDHAAPDEEGPAGALLVITRRDLVDRLGPAPTDGEVRDLARILTDLAGKLGA
ncbi:hypothetical protein [Streptomyces glaucescens]|uniref:Uncharacterized protein n=1 Tax=Streptomyces glaucescens TaxID=1907 RepID=A0A089X5M7_STRGA|nr:hypothetical protein [Streptomyces glaucescens]AIR96349.1 hypothetical protein SGLAU_01605 [Streptomyces glaucescens]